jgi:hypothetical protein
MIYASFSSAWPVATIPLISGTYVHEFVHDGRRSPGRPCH